jgi:hypothetical protein
MCRCSSSRVEENLKEEAVELVRRMKWRKWLKNAHKSRMYTIF